MKRNIRGITLIALVITIIILIILAGVSIMLLIGNDGLLSKTTNAEKQSNEGAARERLELLLSELRIDKYKDSDYNEVGYINDRITNQENMQVIEGDIVEVDGYQFKIDRTIPKIIASLGKKGDTITTEKEESFVELYQGRADQTGVAYLLSDSIENYDFLILYCDNSTASGIVSMMIETSGIEENDIDQFFMTNSANCLGALRYIRFGFQDAKNFKISNITGNSYITRITGMKKNIATKKELLSGVANEAKKDYILNDSIKNFDYIIVYADSPTIEGAITNTMSSEIALKNSFLSINWYDSTTRAIRYGFTNDNTFKINSFSDNTNITRIIGIKFENLDKKNTLYSGSSSQNNQQYALKASISDYDLIMTYVNHITAIGITTNVIESKYIMKNNINFMTTVSPPNTIRAIRFKFDSLRSFITYGIVGDAYMQAIDGIKIK